jgi:hypothetical protein
MKAANNDENTNVEFFSGAKPVFQAAKEKLC